MPAPAAGSPDSAPLSEVRWKNIFFGVLRMHLLSLTLLPLFLAALLSCKSRYAGEPQSGSHVQSTASQNPPVVTVQQKRNRCALKNDFMVEFASGQQPDRFAFTVHHFSPPVHAEEAYQRISSQLNEETLFGVVNAGFFDDTQVGQQTQLYSYYQSAPPWTDWKHWSRAKIGGNVVPKHPGMNYNRPCMTWKGYGHRVEYQQTDEAFWRETAANPTRNVFCAGPLLVRDSKNIWETGAYLGGFSPASRGEAKDDPLDLFAPVSRMASCVKANGNVLLQAYSPIKCGRSMEKLATQMQSLGCREAMAHDGGRSVGYFFRVNGQVFQTTEYPQQENSIWRHRASPVWWAVSLRAK